MKTIADVEMDRLSGVPLETCYEELLKIAYRLSSKKEKREDGECWEAEALYSIYPRKAGKPAAIRAIKVALKKVPFEILKERVERYAEWHKATYQELQYTPHPATWFNQERWNDLLLNPVAHRLLSNGRSLLEDLKARIRNSPAFPGGPRYVDYTTPETKAQLKSDIEELERLCPGFELRTLR